MPKSCDRTCTAWMVIYTFSMASLCGCAGTPVKAFTSNADTQHLDHEQKVIWQVSDEQDVAFQNTGVIYADPQLQNYLQAVVDRLYPEFHASMRVHIIKNPAPNAFMMANGSCYVQLGLLALLDNEAELGTVLGHEGGHFVRQHGLQEHEHVENTAMLAVPLFGPALAASSMYGYSRDMEAEADSIGFQRMQTAGYDVHQAVVPFQRLDAYSQALDIKQPYFYADHPKLAERIQNFSAQIAQTTQQGGYVGEEEYLAAVHAARLWVLQEDLNRQDYKSLIFLLEDGRELAKYPAEARYYLGSAYLLRSKEGDAQKAEDEFRTCAGQAQDFPPVYAALGRLLMNQHKDAEALTDFQRYLQLSPEAADAAYVRMYIRRLSPAQADRGKS